MSQPTGAGFIRLFYIVGTNQHVARFRTYITGYDSGTGKANLQQRDGNSVVAETAVTALVTALKAVMNTTTTFQYYELWGYPESVNDAVFAEQFDLNIAGTSASAVVAGSQIVFSYRSSLGGNGKLYLMDGTLSPNQLQRPPNFGTAQNKAIADYLLGSTCVVRARDNGFANAVTKMVTKTNDALRKRYRLV